jgi:hypothetical protein
MAKKKKKSIDEQIADESPYQRAAAIWVARKRELDPDKLLAVDWYHEDGWSSASGTGYEGESGLEFYYNGKHDRYAFWDYRMTPGKFIEECVEILKEFDA